MITNSVVPMPKDAKASASMARREEFMVDILVARDLVARDAQPNRVGVEWLWSSAAPIYGSRPRPSSFRGTREVPHSWVARPF